MKILRIFVEISKGQNEKLEENLKEFMLCMSLCHTVVVDIKTEEEDDDDHNNNNNNNKVKNSQKILKNS